MLMNTSNLVQIVEKKSVPFRTSLLIWASRGLREYPWRTPDKSSYQILVAEILLKRTTASAAAKVYDSFLKMYPNPIDLANASERELVQHLKHVGLYQQRARDIAKLARHLIQEENGIVPCLLDKLLKVPGLGEYSARAILSFGCGVPVAVVDTNVERVITRVFNNTIPKKPSRDMLQKIADELLCKDAHRQFNFGLLDLGAVICCYSVPRHRDCPLTELCDFFRLGQEESLPAKPDQRLRKIRKEKGFSLTELARRAGMSKLTIINIEAGRTMPQLSTIQKLADALGVKPADLLKRR